LKIENFHGKFQAETATVASATAQPSTTSGISLKREEDKFRPTASFKLKQAFAETSITSQVKAGVAAEQKIHVEARDNFDVEKLEQAFDAYIQQHKPETTIVVALKAHKPNIQGETILVEIDNQLQMERLEGLKLNLQNFLMKQLNNGAITLAFEFFDDSNGKEEKKLITSQDKLEHFIEVNPVVEKMCKMFGLQFE